MWFRYFYIIYMHTYMNATYLYWCPRTEFCSELTLIINTHTHTYMRAIYLYWCARTAFCSEFILITYTLSWMQLTCIGVHGQFFALRWFWLHIHVHTYMHATYLCWWLRTVFCSELITYTHTHTHTCMQLTCIGGHAQFFVWVDSD